MNSKKILVVGSSNTDMVISQSIEKEKTRLW
jgi:hypothetical protein